MKNKLVVLSITALSASALLFYSCKREFLDRPPQGVYSEDQLANKKGIEGMLIGAYATLDGRAGTWYEGGSNWVWGSVTGGDALKGSEASDQVDINPIMKYDFSPTNPPLSNKWRSIWGDGVARANQVLKTLPKATDLTDAEKKQIEGEARFLRGYHHFDAKKLYNNVPYVDEKELEFKNPNTDASGNYVNIWPQIEADLKFAYDNLDEVKPNRGRVNKWAAGSFLAKAYMFQKKFAEARTLFDAIIASGKTAEGKAYNLTANFHENFRVLTEHNTESIFAIESTYGDGSTTNGNYDNALNYPHSPSTPGAGCCGFFQPTQNLVNSYKTDAAGLPMPDTYNNSDVTRDANLVSSDPFTPYAGNLDPRLDWTVGRRGIPYLDWGVHPGRDWIRDVGFGGPYSPKKNVFYKSDIGALAGSVGWGWNNEALNVMIMRFADVLLMAAEAEIEGGSLTKALGYINRVRARAAASPVKKADGTNAANYLVSQYTTFANADEARKAVRFERKLELAMEGHRFFDLVRWGVADVFINSEYLPKEAPLYSKGPLTGAVFTKGKNEYLPIPSFAIVQSAKDGVATLKQNPNY